MNLNDLTLGQLKELGDLLKAGTRPVSLGLGSMVGQKVIIRTHSAGVWFGELVEKEGKEVTIKKARRMWKWWASESISLSAYALHGIKGRESKIVQAVPSVWLEAVEIIPCTPTAILSLEGAANAEAL